MNVNRVLGGIFSSWASFVVTAATSLVMAPFLVRTMGNEGYGLWSLYMAITGYFALLDFGVSPAVVRYTSRYKALGDREAERRVVATGMCFFLAIGALIGVLTLFGTLYYENIFPHPGVPVEVAQKTFLLVGLDFAFVLPCAVFQGILIGHQQYVALQGVNISVRLLRFGAVMLMIEPGNQAILVVALIFFLTGLFRDFGYITFARRQLQGIPSPTLFDRQALRELLSYSLPAFIIAVALRVQSYTDSLVIGYVVGVGAITPFALAGSLVDYVHEIGWGLTNVLVPVISTHEARGEHARVREQFLNFTRYCVWLMIPIGAVTATLSESFFIRWVGPEYRESAHLLDVLLAAMAIYVVQLPGQAVLKGLGKHRRLAGFMFLEALLNLILSLGLAHKIGVMGVAIGTLIPRILVTGLILAWHVRSVLGVGFREVLNEAFKPGVPGGIVMVILMIAWQQTFQEPASWLVMVLTGIVFVASFGLVTLRYGARDSEVQWVRSQLKAVLTRLGIQSSLFSN